MKRLLSCLFLLLTSVSLIAATPQVTELTTSNRITWDGSLTLPAAGDSAHLGLAGVFSGFLGEELLVAGGANFPDGLPTEGGVKRFHADLYIYSPANESWRTIPNALPQPMAYGLSIPLEEGILCIGGCNAEGCLEEVFALTLANGEPRIERYPSLPVPLANAAGGRIGSKIYVAGGIEQVVNSKATTHFLVLDLNHLDRGWQSLAPWPGAARAFAVAATQSDGFDTCFYLF